MFLFGVTVRSRVSCPRCGFELSPGCYLYSSPSVALSCLWLGVHTSHRGPFPTPSLVILALGRCVVCPSYGACVRGNLTLLLTVPLARSLSSLVRTSVPSRRRRLTCVPFPIRRGGPAPIWQRRVVSCGVSPTCSRASCYHRRCRIRLSARGFVRGIPIFLTGALIRRACVSLPHIPSC